ncbi:hypothetical protein EYF80_059299 [Liparis tanakae]|uniref:Uncharacterized protein n=1 Tax=Liparis tanakae TaxID=230148 RepID=A0A4Z2EP59_9TELE|nr:hypothetical protein EYF80_059299 [Liparis tanakae]
MDSSSKVHGERLSLRCSPEAPEPKPFHSLVGLSSDHFHSAESKHHSVFHHWPTSSSPSRRPQPSAPDIWVMLW